MGKAVKVKYILADTAAEFEIGRELFTEYVRSLSVDLSFQDVDKELQTVEEQYNKPHGGLLIAYTNSVAIGCAGIRKIEGTIAELKRMYVKSEYRSVGVGMGLLERSMDVARKLGYNSLRLDTLANMTKAQELYRSYGFCEIPPYCFNPLPGTIYMEKTL